MNLVWRRGNRNSEACFVDFIGSGVRDVEEAHYGEVCFFYREIQRNVDHGNYLFFMFN